MKLHQIILSATKTIHDPIFKNPDFSPILYHIIQIKSKQELNIWVIMGHFAKNFIFGPIVRKLDLVKSNKICSDSEFQLGLEKF